MEIEPVIFDSRNELYKSPVGAVTSGTEVTFTILVSEDLHPTKVGITMLYDRHETPAYYEMAPDSTGGSYGDTGAPASTEEEPVAAMKKFTVSITIGDTGLYWYHFVIDTDNGTLLAGKSGKGNRAQISEEPSSWQQTVYDRKYEIPEWICGGAFYHIFVDRFYKGSSPADAGAQGRALQQGQEPPAQQTQSSGPEPSARPSGQEPQEQHPEQLPPKVVRNDWGGTPYWKPVDGKVYNNDFFGGNIRGIIEKLPYLESLGATCLYLSPVFEAYSSHKYDTGDYEKIDEMFGTEAELRELCEKAGELGMRVILDGVFAHTGADSKYFNKYGTYGSAGAWNDPDSPYRSWYFFHEDGTYDSWWDFDTLPKLNKLDPGYIEYITGEDGIIRKWLRAGISGWRLDVADELPVSFLTKLVNAAKSEKPDSLIVGEVWEDASNKEAYSERKNYFEGDRLDSVMNYPFREGIIDFVRNGNAEGLAETVEQIAENYPREVVDCLMNLLGTHDSIRIVTALAGEDLGRDPARELQAETRLDRDGWDLGVRRLKAASLLQITLPGVPCIYYGDEAGVEGYKDPFNRTCYPWGYENKELQSWYRLLLNYRKSNPVFRHGAYRTIKAGGGVFAFMRFGESGKDIIAAANMSDKPEHLCLFDNGDNQFCDPGKDQPDHADGRDGKENEIWRDVMSAKEYRGEVLLSPGEAILLEKAGN